MSVPSKWKALRASVRRVAASDERGPNAPRSADGSGPRAKHPALWFIALYGGGVVVTTLVATVFHILVFSASK